MRTTRPRAWREGPPVAGRTSPRVEVERDLELEAQRFRKLAPVFGWCGTCGVVVDEANGKLHGYDCSYLPAERRKAVGDP